MEKVLLLLIGASALCSVCSFTDRKYIFVYEPKTWTEAQSFCRSRYTDLVTVDSLDMVTMLNGMVDTSKMGSVTEAWIGLSFVAVSWQWSLTDETFYSSNANFRKWNTGEPNSAWFTAECAQMYDSGTWNDAPCEWKRQFFCSSISDVSPSASVGPGLSGFVHH
ncbi:L-selectin-like [Cyprinodon tularosa]|uniref:L-selectin-like n=1 Tax=Cyprinodon tularosa TaxID=77115 RepID=UPI0018E20791|nr:L-selectin-like [Cyprinodon tularosa]